MSEEVSMSLERTLDYWSPGASEAAPIRVTISVPEPHPRYDWACTLTVEGFEESYSKTFSGADAIQALTLTLSIVPSVLRYLSRNRGSVRWNDSENLGFPPLTTFYELDLVPADGGQAREIAVRIGAAERNDTQSWSVLVEVYGFDEPHQQRVQGADWTQALELAARTVPGILDRLVQASGGGTLTPRLEACPVVPGS